MDTDKTGLKSTSQVSLRTLQVIKAFVRYMYVYLGNSCIMGSALCQLKEGTEHYLKHPTKTCIKKEHMTRYVIKGILFTVDWLAWGNRLAYIR